MQAGSWSMICPDTLDLIEERTLAQSLQTAAHRSTGTGIEVMDVKWL